MQRAAVMEWFKHNPVKVFLLILILVSASVAAVFTYFGFFSPKTAPYASVESYPLRVSMELGKGCFDLGETVEILCKLKNIGDEPITIHYRDIWGYTDRQNNTQIVYFDITIKEKSDTVVWQWSYNYGFATAVLFDFTVNPGEERSTLFPWYQETNSPHAPVPSGEYTVSAVMPPWGNFRIDDGQPIAISIPPLTFMIHS